MRTAALAALLLAACGGGAAPTSTTPTTARDDVPLPAGTPRCTTLTAAPVTEAALHTAITLEDPGAEPRRALRYAPDDGARLALTSQLVVDFDYGAGSQRLPGNTAHLVHDVQTDGADAIAHRFVIEETDIVSRGMPQETVDALAADLERSRCGSITVRTDARGRWLGTTLAGALPSGAQQLQPIEEMLHAFPEEPVGPGALWRVAVQRNVNAVVVDFETSIELVAVDGDVVTLAGAILGSAAPQSIDSDGMRLDVKEARIARAFDTKIDLRTLRLEGASRGGLRMDASGDGQDVVFQMQSEIRVRPE